MNKLLILVLGLLAFSAFSISAQQVKSLNTDEQALYVSAMNLLNDDDYSVLESFQKDKHAAAITFLFDNQLRELTKDKTSLDLIKSKAMFSLGAPATLPFYVRRDSKFYQSILKLYGATKDMPGVTVSPAAMALAAKFAHEIYHIRNPQVAENETSAIEHEKSMFTSFAQRYATVLNTTAVRGVVGEYIASLDADLEIAKNNR